MGLTSVKVILNLVCFQIIAEIAKSRNVTSVAIPLCLMLFQNMSIFGVKTLILVQNILLLLTGKNMGFGVLPRP